MSEQTTKTDIKKVSSFKLRVELLSRDTDEKTIIPQLSDFSEEEIRAEMTRRHSKDSAFVRMEMSDDIIDVQVEGTTIDIAVHFVRLFLEQPDFARIIEGAIHTAKKCEGDFKNYKSKTT